MFCLKVHAKNIESLIFISALKFSYENGSSKFYLLFSNLNWIISKIFFVVYCYICVARCESGGCSNAISLNVLFFRK